MISTQYAQRSLLLLTLIIVCWSHTLSAAPSGKGTLRNACGHTLRRPASFFGWHYDTAFLKKFFKHWIPFTSSARVKMQFYLYKRDFPDCGRELLTDEDEMLAESGFDAAHPTRIIIHGWMSQSKGSLNRAVKNAYLSLTQPRDKPPLNVNDSISSSSSGSSSSNGSDSSSSGKNSTTGADIAPLLTTITTPSAATTTTTAITKYTDFNIIVCDWSVISSNVNYFGVVELIEDLGLLLVEFMRHLHMRAGLQFDDVYLIGHSLGAQIAGSAGKQIYPFRINTIFALDPAGPKFRDASDEYRIDPSDALYVESIQTSSSLGFEEPVGHATFYPNYGKDQKKCYMYGCSHSRAHRYFAESITSEKGFWGTLAQRNSSGMWILSGTGVQFRMGGEPSTPKRGTFYVQTNGEPPYAMGRPKWPDHYNDTSEEDDANDSN